MKNGSTFIMAVAVLCVLGLTQGCVTSDSSGSGRGAGAKHKGFYKGDHKGKSSDSSSAGAEQYTGYEDATMMDESTGISEGDYSSSVEPVAIVAADSNYDVYIVQKGDMLSQLAVDFDTTTANLVQMNNLSNPDVLYVGQELKVPAGRSGSPATTSKSSGSIKKGGTYTIQKGDTLSEIALAAGVSIDDLRSLNGINGDTIMAGETLDIPAYGKVPAERKAAAATPTATPDEPAAVEPATTDEPAAAPEVYAPAPAAVGMTVPEVMYPGETLDDKASDYGVTKAEIMRLNGITNESQVKEGMTIQIPISE